MKRFDVDKEGIDSSAIAVVVVVVGKKALWHNVPLPPPDSLHIVWC